VLMKLRGLILYMVLCDIVVKLVDYGCDIVVKQVMLLYF
jgi:hypothetical protein